MKNENASQQLCNAMTQRNPTAGTRRSFLSLFLSPGKGGPCDDPLTARAAEGGRALAIIGDGVADHVRLRSFQRTTLEGCKSYDPGVVGEGAGDGPLLPQSSNTDSANIRATNGRGIHRHQRRLCLVVLAEAAVTAGRRFAETAHIGRGWGATTAGSLSNVARLSQRTVATRHSSSFAEKNDQRQHTARGFASHTEARRKKKKKVTSWRGGQPRLLPTTHRQTGARPKNRGSRHHDGVEGKPAYLRTKTRGRLAHSPTATAEEATQNAGQNGRRVGRRRAKRQRADEASGSLSRSQTGRGERENDKRKKSGRGRKFPRWSLPLLDDSLLLSPSAPTTPSAPAGARTHSTNLEAAKRAPSQTRKGNPLGGPASKNQPPQKTTNRTRNEWAAAASASGVALQSKAAASAQRAAEARRKRRVVKVSAMCRAFC
ncbi:hypothetical protein HPB51_021190 [Rhipicephalus microplus]|uniref:Uncharacterized protein n=1 Tax=Rhipicephalus microplus TaxID=6941 RepID=A0A9J6F5N4_RHIMP|nr:hypothetical protein HPB51_021190 [Rhipicephalus microplus]